MYGYNECRIEISFPIQQHGVEGKSRLYRVSVPQGNCMLRTLQLRRSQHVSGYGADPEVPRGIVSVAVTHKPRRFYKLTPVSLYVIEAAGNPGFKSVGRLEINSGSIITDHSYMIYLNLLDMAS